MSEPRISVVVLTYNRMAQLIDTLLRLRALPERPPIVVADNGSSDDTVRMVAMLFPDITIVQCGGNLGAAGRNLAVDCVRTDYVAFCDDDTWWKPGSLAHAVRLLDAYPRVGILNARIEVGEARETDPISVLMQHSPLDATGLPGPSLVGYMAGASVMRTAVFRQIGGYDARYFIGGEEERVALDVLAAGHAIVYCAACAIAHHPSPLRDSALRRRMLARNAAWTAWQRLAVSDACRATARAIECFRKEGTLWQDGFALLRGLRWALRERRRIPERVAAMLAEVRLDVRAPRRESSRSELPQRQV
ncbi:glycosyltransferase [Paraburkholderia sp. SARCC-3016]|uniref:glycosyltransferase family 2 protein n=1 Tax=Paraburkholderia sp. SARCC-3016 TaxID=3058611 RepID=UPI002807B60E|nr:glycosyltransferase [Paraburkholderia sp. SARCC-3016]MDQ7978879.1 glycosyltransferase [Paraburkholderia sp. SARCC-3016]